MGLLGAANLRLGLRAIFDAAVTAAHPEIVLPSHLPAPPPRGRVIVLAGGKAGASMAVAAERHYRDTLGLGADRLTGIAITRPGYAKATAIIPVIEAGHPVPDSAGLEATARLLALADGAMAEDLVLVLLSGGASAAWVAPAGRLTLTEYQTVTRALLRSGATIGEVNTVRKRLSRVQGGRLAQRVAPASLVTLAISDVPSDDPSTIGSGPTVPDPTTHEQALSVLGRRGIALPPNARDLFADSANETPKPGDPVFETTAFRIIARPSDMVAAAASAALRFGYEPLVLGADIEGEARAVAEQHAALTRDLLIAGRRVAVISGGELTVTVRGSGKGGPNQEYALALAMALEGARGFAALAADTDGTDGGEGHPNDPAGAFVDERTMPRASHRGLDAAAFLAQNNSTAFFADLGDLLVTGPTLTNVNDLRIILVRP